LLCAGGKKTVLTPIKTIKKGRKTKEKRREKAVSTKPFRQFSLGGNRRKSQSGARKGKKSWNKDAGVRLMNYWFKKLGEGRLPGKENRGRRTEKR